VGIGRGLWESCRSATSSTIAIAPAVTTESTTARTFAEYNGQGTILVTYREPLNCFFELVFATFEPIVKNINQYYYFISRVEGSLYFTA
jgi:hypothetical protein